MSRLATETVRVNVGVNRLNNGIVEIDVARVGPHLGAVVMYPSTARARAVLLALGFTEKEVDSRLRLLTDHGANERLPLPQADLPLGALWAQGFKV
jgi:alkylhydroperoxidase family enzyme